jgi:predicted RNA binding protein YcfA (HicA-like mRNA interferase family)
MPNLPNVTGNAAITAFQKAGFEIVRRNGSHVVLKKSGHKYNLSVPVHGKKSLGKGLLKSLIDNAGMTLEEFCELL